MGGIYSLIELKGEQIYGFGWKHTVYLVEKIWKNLKKFEKCLKND